MTGEPRELPPGFVALTVGTTRAVCGATVAPQIRKLLDKATLYDFAASSPTARAIAGRGTAYVASLPDGERVVVRHNRHGGALASLTRDFFRAPTRAPLELQISERLRGLGIPTPVILAYATYPAAPGLWRADVMTRYVSPSADLAAVLMTDDQTMRAEAWEATARLVREMSAGGVRHHDLNAKNVLLHLQAGGGGPSVAMLLDVDRVVFDEEPERALDGNLSRLFRSLRKWRSLYGARVDESEIDALARRVREVTAAPSMTRS